MIWMLGEGEDDGQWWVFVGGMGAFFSHGKIVSLVHCHSWGIKGFIDLERGF